MCVYVCTSVCARVYVCVCMCCVYDVKGRVSGRAMLIKFLTPPQVFRNSPSPPKQVSTFTHVYCGWGYIPNKNENRFAS